jgi:high affinity sulfate transporter 1
MAVPDSLLRRTAPADPAGWRRWLPGLQTLTHYQASWLRHDVFAGLVLTSMLVPVGIAYAEAAGLPGIYGLYATVVPLVAYALVGPSRILVLGPDSSLAPLILTVVLPLSVGDPQRAVLLAGAMAVVSGLVSIVAGVARLGFVTELLSKPIRYGYMNGIALTVLLSQVPKLLGFSVDAKGPLRQAWAIVEAILAGRTNTAALAVGGGALLLILLLKHYLRRPGVLAAVVLATVAVAVLDLPTRAGIAVLGTLPHGLPRPALPLIGMADLVPVLTAGLAVALVSFADTSVLSRTYAARTHMPVDPNQELIGLGAANLAAGFFQGFPISSSSSRTPVAESAGARTQLSSLIAAAAIALLLVFAPGLLRYVPQTALAAVVIAAALGLFEFAELRRIYRMQRWEFWLSMLCFAGVAVFGAIPGITIAIIVAVIEFLWDGWRPHSAVLGKVEGIAGFHDISRHPQARLVPGLVILRWDAPLFFANAELFRERVLRAVAAAPQPVKWLVLAAEPVTSIDVTSADALRELSDTLEEAGVELRFSEMKDPVKDKLRRFGLYARFAQSFSATVSEAVDTYLASHPAEAAAFRDAPR